MSCSLTWAGRRQSNATSELAINSPSGSALDVANAARRAIFGFPPRREPKGGCSYAMPLHRDIYWVGRQWAVTGYGIQACDQKQKGQFDIEGSRLWEDGVLDSVRALKWLNAEDFEKAVSVARRHYPQPPRSVPPAEPSASPPPKENSSLAPGQAAATFQMRTDAVRAKLVPVWRVRPP